MRPLLLIFFVQISQFILAQDTCKNIQSQTDSFLVEGQTKIELHLSFDKENNPYKGMVDVNLNGYVLHCRDLKGIIGITIPVGRYKIGLSTFGLKPVVTDSLMLISQHKYVLKVIFDSEVIELPRIIYSYDKPVIYLYPEKSTEVTVQLNFKGEIMFTYPALNKENSWNVLAEPDGTFTYMNKKYRYLFWEGTLPEKLYGFDPSKGFVIQKDSLLPFLEHALTLLGLNSIEQQDFITYWYPKMLKNEFNFIHFMTNEAYEKTAPLKVTPQPNSCQRIFMVWKKFELSNQQPILPQELTAPNRNGFTLIEWGGCEIKNERKSGKGLKFIPRSVNF